MKYIDRKRKKQTEAKAKASVFSSIIVRLAVLALLAFAFVQGCNYVVNAIHNAPVEDWKMEQFRKDNLRGLIGARSHGWITEEYFKEQVAKYNDSLRCLEAYREER